MMKGKSLIGLIAFLVSLFGTQAARAQTLDKIRLGYSGTGINNYVLEMGKRAGIFKKNGLDVEVVYVNSGSLLSQALIAGTFDLSFSQGSEATVDYAFAHSVQVLDRRPFPTLGGIQTVPHELGKEAKAKPGSSTTASICAPCASWRRKDR